MDEKPSALKQSKTKFYSKSFGLKVFII